MARVNSVTAAAAGVILLGAGFGLGVIVAGAGPTEKVVKHIASGDRSAGAVAAPAPEASSSPSPSPAPASASAPAPGAAAAARALLDALPPPAFPEGTGVVTGRVVREDGTPLPGVLASLSPERPPGIVPARTMWDPEPNLEATVVESALQSRWYREARKTALSDPDGRFRFDGVADVGHGLQLRLRGWRIQPKDWKLARRVRPGADIEFTAFPQVEWTVEVVRADGSVPEEAQIQFVAGNQNMGMGWSPGAVIQVKPGTWQVSATVGERQELKSEAETVVLEQGKEPPALRFVVRGSPGIRGKVILEGYTSTRGVEVAVARIPPDGKADPVLLSGATALRETAWTNRDGEFLFGELAPGRYLLGASMGRRSSPVVAEEVEVAGDLVTRDLRITRLDAADFAVVLVQGPGGAPVEVTGITTGYRSGTSSSSGGGSWLRRDDGAYLIEHQDTSGIGGGGGAAAPEDAVWWVEVQTAAHGTRREEYRRGPHTRLMVAFEEPAFLDVTVTGFKGSPLEGVLQANLVHASDSNRYAGNRGRGPKLDAEGRMTLPGLPRGEYVLVLTPAGHRWGMAALARIPVTVRAGRNPLAVPVPVLYRVAVSGVDGSARLSKKGEPYWTMSATADAEGRVAFDGLPEGAYQVQCGQKSAEFDLPGTAEVRL